MQKNQQKIWSIQKKAVPLHAFSLEKHICAGEKRLRLRFFARKAHLCWRKGRKSSANPLIGVPAKNRTSAKKFDFCGESESKAIIYMSDVVANHIEP